MLTIYTTFIFFTFLCFAVSQTSAAGGGVQISKLGGVNFVAEGFEGPLSYDSPLSLQSLTDAKTIGISHIVYSFPWYVDNINSTMLPYRVDGGCPTGVPLNNASSPTDDSVVTAIRATKALGMSVVLRPMVDLNWNFPENRGGAISRSDIGKHFDTNTTQWDSWFASYTQFILHWASIAAAENVELFCVGAELRTTETQETRWRNVFAAVRKIYSGKVYYSGEGEDIKWWDASDYIAQDAYPSLTNSSVDPTTVTIADLVSAWNSTINSLYSQSVKHNRPVLLSETGICSISKKGLYNLPWFFECYQYNVNLQVQANYYEAVFQSLWNKDWIAGVFFWKWSSEGGPSDPTFFPRNKPAANVMSKYFK
jgi:hypothetical protein